MSGNSNAVWETKQQTDRVRRGRTSLDYGMLAIAILPPLLLVGFGLLAAWRWQVGESQIDESLSSRFSDDVLESSYPLADYYRSQTSTEQTDDLLDVLSAAERLNRQYNMVFNAQEGSIDWQNQDLSKVDIGSFVQEYMREAQPLLARLQQIDFDGESIWLPRELGNPYDWNHSFSEFREIEQLLAQAIRTYASVGETERSLAMIRKMNQIYSSDTFIWLLQEQIQISGLEAMYAAIANAIESGNFSEEELVELQQLISTSVNWQLQWTRFNRELHLQNVPWIQSGELRRDRYRSRQGEGLAKFAPSDRKAAHDYLSKVSELTSPGTLKVIERRNEMEAEYRRSIGSGIDTAWQMPTYGISSDVFNSDSQWLQVRQMVAKNNQRFLKTLLGVGIYEKRHGEFPDSLNDLVDVGLNVEDTHDVEGHSFSYTSDEDGVYLGNLADYPESIQKIYFNQAIHDGHLHHLVNYRIIVALQASPKD